MIDFLLDKNFYLYIILEFSAAITGIFCLKKYTKSPVKYFIYFLVFVAFAELFCAYNYFVRPNKFLYFLKGTKFEKNHWWANIYWVIGAILFYAFYYRKILHTILFKNIIKTLQYVFLIFSIVYIALHWEAFFNSFFVVLDLSGALVIFACTVLYFIEILLSDKILHFYKSINFYISATIFIWWLIITPMSFYDVYYKYEVGKSLYSFYDQEFYRLRRLVFLFSNIFMYLTFIFAFIWCKPENEL